MIPFNPKPLLSVAEVFGRIGAMIDKRVVRHASVLRSSPRLSPWRPSNMSPAQAGRRGFRSQNDPPVSKPSPEAPPPPSDQPASCDPPPIQSPPVSCGNEKPPPKSESQGL